MINAPKFASLTTMTGAELFVYETEALRAGDTVGAQAVRAHLAADRTAASDIPNVPSRDHGIGSGGHCMLADTVLTALTPQAGLHAVPRLGEEKIRDSSSSGGDFGVLGRRVVDV